MQNSILALAAVLLGCSGGGVTDIPDVPPDPLPPLGVNAVAKADPAFVAFVVDENGPFVTPSGDFEVSVHKLDPGSGIQTSVGDGHDDTTKVTFVFEFDANWSNFDLNGTLKSALLRLTLKTTGGVHDDAITINEGVLTAFAPVEVRTVPPGATATVEIELLDHYTSGQLMDTIRNYDGIPFVYRDDATILEAELRLVQ